MVSARCGSGGDWHLVAPRIFTLTDRLHTKSPMAGNTEHPFPTAWPTAPVPLRIDLLYGALSVNPMGCSE
ncbi:hypothetical protein GGP41_006674 [Bipolaris sorokiniana]|uniref:Uncharacterized protein n=1 Tax=Cochliobolus sativus TaxID=45130 RepID=A0A8H6DZL3_COCSA|nr:hypothetical protein GGP41_006674 [Bipolaris sorokiniana]